MYENRIMKLFEFVLRKREGDNGEGCRGEYN
jgi:hypothetical protein